MSDFTQPLLDLLNSLVPMGSQHASEYYTLNEFFVYIFFMFLVIAPFVFLATIPLLLLKAKGKKL